MNYLLNGLKKFWGGIIGIAAVILIWYLTKTCDQIHATYTAPRHINAVVIRKFRETYNHNSRVIELGNGEKFTLKNGLLNLWDSIEIGDSLSKLSGSLEFTLYKDDTVLTFIPDCL